MGLWRGARPLHVMTLEDRVLYRALGGLISEALPERLYNRADRTVPECAARRFRSYGEGAP